ncbi:LOW QUALITY PROTEIN: inhibitor of carbonic anhydrase-like [Pongo abelii]|uniref:LOW QUALITY PROTEIN: inhibitor of carbonic anhydrase-like n=1 Tax=Pongo abelii TaxID=9601 RepID=UPI003007EAA5
MKKFPHLCQMCAGKGTDKCACSSQEPYFGYAGALRLLAAFGLGLAVGFKGPSDKAIASVTLTGPLDLLPSLNPLTFLQEALHQSECGPFSVSLLRPLVLICFWKKILSQSSSGHIFDGSVRGIGHPNYGSWLSCVRLTWAFPPPENLANHADRDQYELLCLNNTGKPVVGYKSCHLAWVPSHAVMAQSVGGKEDLIWKLLNQVQEHFGKDKSSEFQLFGSPNETDLLFTDAAHGFLMVPPKMDAKLYLGDECFSATQDPKREHFRSKSVNLPMEEEQLTASEVFSEMVLLSASKDRQSASLRGYYVMAVVKKSDADVTWNSL